MALADDLLGNIRDSVNDGLVGNPHKAWRNPSARVIVGQYLTRRSSLGNNMRDRRACIPIPNEVERHNTQLLIKGPLPAVPVSPPSEFVALVVFASAATHIHARIVAELELDGVGG